MWCDDTDLLYRASNICWEATLAVTGRESTSTHVVYRTKSSGPENSPKCQLQVGTQVLKGCRPGEGDQWRGVWHKTYHIPSTSFSRTLMQYWVFGFHKGPSRGVRRCLLSSVVKYLIKGREDQWMGMGWAEPAACLHTIQHLSGVILW